MMTLFFVLEPTQPYQLLRRHNGIRKWETHDSLKPYSS
jgi:hypothetical protein